MKSLLQQFVHHPDGSITVQGASGLRCEVIQEQGRVQARDLERALGLPHWYEDWEVLATPRGLSRRFVRFILCDESMTRLPGNLRLQPRSLVIPDTGVYLEFGHRGFVIGVVFAFVFGFKENRDELRHMGIEVPIDVEGDYLIATARLFDSALAEKAWEALPCGIFTNVCPLLLRQHHEPPGTGKLVEVSMTTGDYPGCPGARILKTWEA